MFNDFFGLNDDSEGTVFRDVIMLALAGFMVLVLIMLPHINPKAQKSFEESKSPGNVIIEAVWPPETDFDVDLWIKGPGDIAVGYSNKGSTLFNLLRDDLGKSSDNTGINSETTVSRGIKPGEYIVNLHLYRNVDIPPVEVLVTVYIKKNLTTSTKKILEKKVKLRYQGMEMTAVRFSLDEKGDLVPDSVHDLPKKIRSGKSHTSNSGI